MEPGWILQSSRDNVAGSSVDEAIVPAHVTSRSFPPSLPPLKIVRVRSAGGSQVAVHFEVERPFDVPNGCSCLLKLLVRAQRGKHTNFSH
jgi:hypothetical protein